MMRFLLGFAFSCAVLRALTLQEAEETALAHNPQVRASEELVERARQGKLESISKWLPQLSLLTQGFRTQKPLTLIKLNKPTAFFTQLSLTQALLSSDLIYDLKIAGFSLTQAEQMLAAARNDVLYETRALFYLAILDRKKVATAKEHIRLLTNLAERVSGLHIIGEATAYQVNQAKVSISNVTDQYYQALKEQKAHHDELVRVLGYDPQEKFSLELQSDIDYLSIPMIAEKVAAGETIFHETQEYSPMFQDRFTQLEEALLEQLFSEGEMGKWVTAADETRPDIRISKTVISIAHERVLSRKGEYWPKLSVLAGYGAGSTPYLEQPSTRLNNEIFQWAAGLSLTWNVFDGMGRERRIQRAKAEERAASFDAQKVVQAAHTDVRDQIYMMEKALSKFLTASANVTLAQQTLGQATSQLDIGYVTIFDYLVSVDGLIRAKTALDEGKFELMRAYFGLLHACGRKNA